MDFKIDLFKSLKPNTTGMHIQLVDYMASTRHFTLYTLNGFYIMVYLVETFHVVHIMCTRNTLAYEY